MIHVPDILAPERQKYADVWSTPEYSNAAYSPGVTNVERFMKIMLPLPGARLIDIGCGHGKAGLEFQRKHKLDVWWLDFTDVGLHRDVPRDRFINSAIWQLWSAGSFDYGFCCDVLEHIPPEFTLLAIDRCLAACAKVWFQIALVPDDYGPMLIGEPLHLTIENYSWWLARLSALGAVIDARDLGQQALYVVER